MREVIVACAVRRIVGVVAVVVVLGAGCFLAAACAAGATGRAGRLLVSSGDVPGWVGGGVDASNVAVCPRGFVCRLGESGPEPVKSDALAAARSAAYAALVSEAYPAELRGRLSIATSQRSERDAATADVTESVERKIDAVVVGRIEGVETLQTYWERRATTPSTTIYFAWSLMGVPESTLRETFPREQAKARKLAAQVKKDVDTVVNVNRQRMGPQFLVEFEKVVLASNDAIGRSIPEQEISDAKARLDQAVGWVSGNTTIDVEPTLSPQRNAIQVAARLLVAGQPQANAAYALAPTDCAVNGGGAGVTDQQGRFQFDVTLQSRLRACRLRLQTAGSAVETAFALPAPYDGVVVRANGRSLANDPALSACLAEGVAEAHSWFASGVSASSATRPAVVEIAMKVLVSDRRQDGGILRTAGGLKVAVSVGDGTAQTVIFDASETVMAMGANNDKLMSSLCEKVIARVKSISRDSMEKF